MRVLNSTINCVYEIHHLPCTVLYLHWSRTLSNESLKSTVDVRRQSANIDSVIVPYVNCVNQDLAVQDLAVRTYGPSITGSSSALFQVDIIEFHCTGEPSCVMKFK